MSFPIFFLRFAPSGPTQHPPPLKPPIPHGSPIVVFYKERIKIGKYCFPMPTAINRFQILNLNPKNSIFKEKKYLFGGIPLN